MPIRWGIIGCGDVTEVKSGPGFQQVKDSELVAVMRRNGTLAEDFARRHGVPYWYDDADKVIHHPEVDAVYIATPPGSHKEYALRVCAAGKPAYIEKPMARSYGECQEMVTAFEKAKLPLFVAYYRRGLARFLKAQELVQSGALGKITGVQYRFASAAHRRILDYLPPDSPHRHIDTANLPWRLRAEEAGGGLFLDLGCHTLDILDFILGAIVEVAGFASNVASPHAVEDSVVMHFRTEGDVPGIASWNFASAIREDLITIQGTEASLELSTFGNEVVRLRRDSDMEEFDLPNPTNIQQPFIETMVNTLLGRGVCASTGITAMRTSWVIDKVLESYYGTRRDAFWLRESEWKP